MLQQIVDKLLAQTEEIIIKYPTVESIRHTITDIPYNDLQSFAKTHDETIHMNEKEGRAYIIHSPTINNKMHSDIWIYSQVVKFKPAEVIEY